MSSQEAINNLVVTYNQARETMTTLVKDTFKDVALEFFVQNPEIAAVYWTQYTPYFNDGDSCEFSVNDLNFLPHSAIEDYEEDGEETDLDELIERAIDEDDDCGLYYFEKSSWNQQNYDQAVAAYGVERTAVLYENASQFADFVHSLPDTVMAAAFDDHVQIILTPNSVIVNEYDHD